LVSVGAEIVTSLAAGIDRATTPQQCRQGRPTKLELRFKMLAGLEASIDDQALFGKIFVFVRLRR
jgi:hypothetical protein